MEKSESTIELTKALVKAQSAFPPILKAKQATIPTKSGGVYSYAYADLGDVVNGVLPVLERNGLAYLQLPAVANGLPALTTVLLHESGEWIAETMLLHIDKADAQGQGSALTYARRYALSAMLGIVTETDDDGARAARRHERANGREDVETIKAGLFGVSKDPTERKQFVLDVLGRETLASLEELDEVEAKVVLDAIKLREEAKPDWRFDLAAGRES